MHYCRLETNSKQSRIPRDSDLAISSPHKIRILQLPEKMLGIAKISLLQKLWTAQDIVDQAAIGQLRKVNFTGLAKLGEVPLGSFFLTILPDLFAGPGLTTLKILQVISQTFPIDLQDLNLCHISGTEVYLTPLCLPSSAHNSPYL